MKKIILLLVIFFTILTGFSQNIKRKGSLGVSFYSNVPDSLVQKLNYKNGVVIKVALPNTTASSLGLLNNDIIIRINENTISSSKELFETAKSLRASEPIEVVIIRNQVETILKGKVIARPKETSDTAEITYGEFSYEKGYVRTIYKTLKGKKPIGTIYFLQGLPCYSMDNFQELDKTKQAIDAMVDRGFAVYRMEKADMGDNVNMPDCNSMGFNEELAMYEAGYNHLLTLKDVDPLKIFLFGHSMGGITAPLLAEKFQPKGVVVYGTGFKPWQEYLFDAFIIQSLYYGDDLGQLRLALEKYKPFIYDYFYGNKSVEEIIKNPLGLMAFQQTLGYDSATGMVASGRNPLTFKELNQQPLASAWGNYENDVLAIYGECDIAANNEKDHVALIDYINSKYPGNGTFWLAEKTTHTFEEIGTMNEYIEWQSNPQAYYQYAATKFNPKVFDYTCGWMKTILAKPTIKKIPALYEDFSDKLPDFGAMGATMDIKIIDIDSDGDLDVILANEFQANSILINDGKGNFTNESKLRLSQQVHDSEDIAAADFNGDGHIDLFFCSEDDKVHEYYINTGKGYFIEAPFKFPNSEANAVLALDVNKDKKMDIILGNNGFSQIYINQGNGTFLEDTNRLPKIERITQDLTMFDMDNDGDLDLFLANENGNLLYQNDGNGFFKDCTETNLLTDINMETRKVSFCDIDKDGDLDLFLANVNFLGNKNPQNRLYINNGEGKFSDATSERLPIDNDHSIDAIFEDVNNDGAIDIVIANVFGSHLKVYLNNSKGLYTDESEAVLGKKYVRDALAIAAADLNGDGQNDIYIADRNNPSINKKDLLLMKTKPNLPLKRSN